MRLLVFGGSWSLGRLVVTNALSRGFDVTVFNEGRSNRPPVTGARHIRGSRTLAEHLRGLAEAGPWDAVVDISGKTPAVVRRSAEALAQAAGRYTSVSTVLVYRDWPGATVAEDSPVWSGDPDAGSAPKGWDPRVYGQLKAGCEVACREAFGDERVLVLRLHTMIGQHEDDGPLVWWLKRARRGGPILLPAPDRTIQVIDVRDVACFLVDQVERGATGTMNVGAPPGRAGDGEGGGARTFGALVRACAEVVAADVVAEPEFVWADEDWLLAQGVRQGVELPLWSAARGEWAVNVDRASAAGLRCRPLADTAARAWQWLRSGDPKADHERITRYGIDPAREAGIIARWRAGAGSAQAARG
jgi:nucleoside-diphosphate-sugar epimerase